MKVDLLHESPNVFDIYLIGVGGQGVLSIGEIIAEAVFRKGLPVSFYPTKGMAQRGGPVKAQLRIGRSPVGAAIPERGADLVIATEVSEALKAIRFIKPGGEFVVFGDVWQPTAVVLGKAAYPALERVLDSAREAVGPGGQVYYISPESLPLFEGAPLPDNIFTLGVVLKRTRLGAFLSSADVEGVLRSRWIRGVERNLFGLRAGLKFGEAAGIPVS